MKNAVTKRVHQQKCDKKDEVIRERFLPPETIADTLRWLDRRTLETKIRLVSRHTNALVCRLMPDVPRLLIDRIDFYPRRDYGELQLIFFRPKLPLTVFPQKPFDQCNVKAIPSYIVCSQMLMEVLFRGTKPKPRSIKAEKKLNMEYESYDGRYALIYCLSLPYPAGENAISFIRDILARPWGPAAENIGHESLKVKTVLESPLVQNCTFLNIYVKKKEIPLCFEWLTERVSDGTMRHLDINFPDGIDVLTAIQPFVDQLTEDVQPRPYHLLMTGEDNNEPQEKQWKNKMTDETLSLRVFENEWWETKLTLLRSANGCTNCYFEEHKLYDA